MIIKCIFLSVTSSVIGSTVYFLVIFYNLLDYCVCRNRENL